MQIANPLSEDTRLVVEYLSFLSRYSKSHLNSIRPGLVPVYNVVHSERGGLVNDIFAQEFFKSVRNIKIQILNKYQEVWDPLLVITSIKENWAVNTNLLLDILQKKPSFCFAWGLSDDQNRIWGDYNVGISTFTLLTQLQDQQGLKYLKEINKELTRLKVSYPLLN